MTKVLTSGPLLLLLLLLLLTPLLACGTFHSFNNDVRINSAEDFLNFVSSVNSGTTFEGTTVFLDSDIKFSSKNVFKPIGDFEHNFLGTFDGQGNTLSNLVANVPSTKYVGLFGYSKGATIMNVIIDESCSLTSLYESSNDAHVGGIIGYCTAYYGPCIVANVVNMGDVTFNGNINRYTLSHGGIAGYVHSYSHRISILNCANYGTVTISGNCSGSIFAGGIAGYYEGYSFTSENTIKNSVNYGKVIYDSSVSPANLFVGGFVGRTIYTTFENCLSAGSIDMDDQQQQQQQAGAIVGCANTTIVNHCFWSTDVNCENAFGVEPTQSTATKSSLAELNSTLVSELNGYAAEGGWGKWLFNAENHILTAKVNYGKGFTVSSTLILLTDIGGIVNDNDDDDDDDSEFYTFSGWFANCLLSEPFSSSEVSEDTTVYSVYGALATVTFNPGKGNVTPPTKVVAYGKPYGEMPVAVIDTNTFIWWASAENATGTRVSDDTLVATLGNHTLYVRWESNLVTFDFGNGKSMGRTVKYNEPIDYPSAPKRKGYKFVGWDKNITSTQGLDVTITALWSSEGISGMMLGIYIGVPVGVFVIIVVCVVIVVVCRKKKRRNNMVGDSYGMDEPLIEPTY